ncbi:DEAD/DEAH box helicase [Sodalis sp. CWE]|uniref:DEAD/DEAH box helicase n=1 Tax=Sodalis sp. CWE TaxID=2803816 RepID=UPI001C7E0D7A|nr:DEAD/DEAH box helicase [Sodalis sp. CWE]MBX4180782.1 DEAD/DEAH box helicase [Sodalis sp. CWE]
MYELNFSSFTDLGITGPVLNALTDLGYKKPSPIQIACIPLLLNGQDVLGMAQTGSGKTAAFSLPLLQNINISLKAPQVLVLTPTRELAIQVGNSFSNFSKYIKNINIATLYGGQNYGTQLRALHYGPQIVVGTPGRLLAHLKNKTLNLSNLNRLVLDEADEMLQMGFIEDVEDILTRIPAKRQTALFSATIPEPIRRISRRFMNQPREISIPSNANTRPDISQGYWIVHGINKNEALMRFLEIEDFDAAIIFIRTKEATLKVSEVLERNGYNSAALNGDMNQALREQTLGRLKDGRLDVLIATDVASRGLDVHRVSLVINYDIPIDSESYVHRIGRTGRAGRPGRALLFVEHHERRLLYNIERIMKSKIQEIKLPTNEMLNARRLAKFTTKVQNQIKNVDLAPYRSLLNKLKNSFEEIDMETLATALLKMAQGERPLLLPPDRIIKNLKKARSYRLVQTKCEEWHNIKNSGINNMDLYRIELGRDHGIEVRHIVGTITNEGNINSHHIGNIKLFALYSTIELPKKMSEKILSRFARTRILNKPINIKLIGRTKSFNGKRHSHSNFCDEKHYDQDQLSDLKKSQQHYLNQNKQKHRYASARTRRAISC